jgi:hypothetical protein
MVERERLPGPLRRDRGCADVLAPTRCMTATVEPSGSLIRSPALPEARTSGPA